MFFLCFEFYQVCGFWFQGVDFGVSGLRFGFGTWCFHELPFRVEVVQVLGIVVSG